MRAPSNHGQQPDIIWLSAQYTEIDGSGKPESYDIFGHGVNDVATIRIKDQNNSDALLISGRPERLLEIARDFVRTAELIVEQTMRDPELRRLYGFAAIGNEPGAIVLDEADDTAGWVRLSTDDVADMSEVFAKQEEDDHA